MLPLYIFVHFLKVGGEGRGKGMVIALSCSLFYHPRFLESLVPSAIPNITEMLQFLDFLLFREKDIFTGVSVSALSPFSLGQADTQVMNIFAFLGIVQWQRERREQ